MKYLIFTLIIGSLFLGNTYASEDRVFDRCGNSAKYASVSWYPTLETKILNIAGNIQKDGSWVLTDGYAELDFCYSKKLDQVIINIPYVENPKFKECINYTVWKYYNWEIPEKSACQDVLNIFSYTINSKKLVQAKRPKEIIYASPRRDVGVPKNGKIYMYSWGTSWYQNTDFALALVNGFGKRVGNIIRMTSWYGDAGCWQQYTWGYNFRTNTMSLIKSDSGCSN